MMIVDRFGVVCAFVTNEYLQHGTKNLPDDIRSSIHDTDLYLNNTKKVSTHYTTSGVYLHPLGSGASSIYLLSERLPPSLWGGPGTNLPGGLGE